DGRGGRRDRPEEDAHARLRDGWRASLATSGLPSSSSPASQGHRRRGLLPGGVSDDAGGGSWPAIGCFYASGEIGPTGVAGVGRIGSRRTHIHGFATVACVMSDFGSPSSSSPSPQGPEANADKSGFEDDSAWG
ncbi:hypothetical protein THAOC_36893, partial [Thalassiosira oceanica]